MYLGKNRFHKLSFVTAFLSYCYFSYSLPVNFSYSYFHDVVKSEVEMDAHNNFLRDFDSYSLHLRNGICVKWDDIVLFDNSHCSH